MLDTVDIDLIASTNVVSTGQQLSVDVVVRAGPSSPVDAVQVYLDFNPSVLEVTGLAVGATLSQQLQSSFDNNLGWVSYAAGTLGDSIELPFTLVTVRFRTVSRSGPDGTDIVFATPTPPRQTRVAVGAGVDTTGRLTPVSVAVQ